MPAIHSRRVFLAAGPATAVFASLSAAARAEARSSDPIFAAIARHEATQSRFCAASTLIDKVAARQEGRAITLADEAEFEAAEAVDDSALDALLATPPTTRAGARAALDYLIGLDRGRPLADFARTLCDSPILAS